jgi:hypothetical protein
MKKHIPGFVPLPFNKVGRFVFSIGVLSLVIKGISYITKWYETGDLLVYFGIGLVIIGLYLTFVVPPED